MTMRRLPQRALAAALLLFDLRYPSGKAGGVDVLDGEPGIGVAFEHLRAARRVDHDVDPDIAEPERARAAPRRFHRLPPVRNAFPDQRLGVWSQHVMVLLYHRHSGGPSTWAGWFTAPGSATMQDSIDAVEAKALDRIALFQSGMGEDAAQAGVFAPSGVDFSAPFQHHAGIME
jgi:hypothetical protein